MARSNMGAPQVAVLIPTFNRADLLQQCLDSIIGQTLPPAQILVVDDGSTDETPEVLRRLRSRVEFIRVAQGGKSAAVNAGMQHARGDYLWIFDDDDVAVADALERLVDPLLKDPEAGFSYGPCWLTPNQPGNRLGDPVGVSRVPDVRQRGLFVPLLESNFLGGGSMLSRMTCVNAVGGFDPTLKRSQDYDFAIRIARRCRGVPIEGGPVFHARQHPGTRGPEQDRFQAADSRVKWLEYDQRIFTRLYHELALEEYLPPGVDITANQRMALLQRAVVMARKELLDFVIIDLAAVAHGPDQSALTGAELNLIEQGLARPSYYSLGLRANLAALRTIERLARHSGPIDEVRRVFRRRIAHELTQTSRVIIRSTLSGTVTGNVRRLARTAQLLRQFVAMTRVP